MAVFRKESLESLRQRVDLVDVLSQHIDLKRTGGSYKALCPFHDEKSPSFVVQRGDSHYHCFGCGAHGDAIAFLMNYQKLNFQEAVESLAERFGVAIEKVEEEAGQKGPSKAALRDALFQASRFFHFYLLYTDEGHRALAYLYNRGVFLEFIKNFQIGLAPKAPGLFKKVMYEKGASDEVLREAGLLSETRNGSLREFFADRITFPILAAAGHVIGFSARKYKEETFGGKYVNTPETPLFKKSRVLFGLSHSRKRIAKERRAIIVEGQVDALQLIHAGFNFTVAGQGTAFGEDQAKELINLGASEIFLAMDGDEAGEEAASKIGNLFQKEGIEVYVLPLPKGSDPDAYLSRHGAEGFRQLIDRKEDYLTFLVRHLGRNFDMRSPAGKHQLVQAVAGQIRKWEHPLMVHESLRKLAGLVHVPEGAVGVAEAFTPNIYVKRQASIGLQTVDGDRVLETDLLRWLLLMAGQMPHLLELARKNLPPDAFKASSCRHIYAVFLEHSSEERPCDLLELASNLDDAEGQLILAELLQKKVNKEKAEEHLKETVQKILTRNWMHAREEVRMKIAGGGCSDDELTELLKQFDELKRNPPQLLME